MISSRNHNKYADDLALLANTPAQTESLLRCLEQAARGIDLHVNANKTEYMCFKREGTISILSDRPLKLVDKFTYISSNISSTENDVIIPQTKAWTAINRLLIIWKFAFSEI